MSISTGMGQGGVVRVYSGPSLSHKEEQTMPFAATRMDLETVILSQVQQTQKDEGHIILLMCGI